MKKTVLKFGVISGIILSMLMVATIPFIDHIGFDNGVIVGYTAITLSLLLVFVGIRSYRDNISNGTITFGRALIVGLLISLISTLFYVVTWEILYSNFLPDFGEKMMNHMMEQVRSSGAGPAEVAAEQQRLKSMGEMYQSNIFFRAAVSFIEPFPVVLVVTLISALILRRKPTVVDETPDAVGSTV